MIKITGIKRALEEYRDNFLCVSRIMLDRATGKVWSDFYALGGKPKKYRRASVIRLDSIINDCEGKINATLIRKYGEAICAEWHTND